MPSRQPKGCLGAYCSIYHMKVSGEELIFMDGFSARPVILHDVVSQVEGRWERLNETGDGCLVTYIVTIELSRRENT